VCVVVRVCACASVRVFPSVAQREQGRALGRQTPNPTHSHISPEAAQGKNTQTPPVIALSASCCPVPALCPARELSCRFLCLPFPVESVFCALIRVPPRTPSSHPPELPSLLPRVCCLR
jgi:hypothetical protein